VSLRALAFGPLPKSQVQASQRLSLPTAGGGNVSGFDAGGQDPGYDAALTVGGPLREPEAFSPVFPDLFGQPPAGGDVTAPDFTSETAQALANPPKGTGVSFPASSGPEAWRTDLDAAFKALKGLQPGVRAVEGPQKAAGGPAPSTGLGALSGGGLDASGFSLTGPDTGGFDWSGFSLGGTSPDVAGLEGFSASDLGSAAGSAGGGGPTASGGIGALTGLYGLGTAAASGNPIGIAQGAINSYGALTGLAGASPISSAIVSAAPEIASAIAESAGIATTGMTAAQLTSAVSGALAAWGGAAAPIIQGIVEYINNAEQMRARESGVRNNPIAGALYANSTAGVGQANKLFDSLGGDLTKANTQDLLGALIGGTNSMLPYYATAQGGRGPIRASDTVTGRKQGPTSPGVGYTGDGASPAQYTQNFTNAQDKMVAAVNELLRRGATYEELGQLPVSGNWALDSLDAYNPLNDLYQANAGKYDTEGQKILDSALTRTAPQQYQSGENWLTQPEQFTVQGYGNVQPQDLTTRNLFTAAQGGAGQAGSNAQSLATGMTGGPLWTALSRMLSPTWGNTQPGSLQDLIQQHFDPWAMVRDPWSSTPSSVGTSLQPILQRAMAERPQGSNV